MVDALAVLICALCLLSCFLLLANTRCQHRRLSLRSQRCADCGMTYREIQVNLRLGLDTRQAQFLDIVVTPCKYDAVFPYLIHRVEKAPPSSQFMYVEVAELSSDAPPHVRELYDSMMLRRHGLSYLWKKHVQTSHT